MQHRHVGGFAANQCRHPQQIRQSSSAAVDVRPATAPVDRPANVQPALRQSQHRPFVILWFDVYSRIIIT